MLVSVLLALIGTSCSIIITRYRQGFLPQQCTVTMSSLNGSSFDLESGSNWTDQDLSKFGIRYHIRVTEPSGIFEKIKPYTSGTRISLNTLAVQKLTEHITKLQENFNNAFVLDVNSFELIEMIDACNEMHGTWRGSRDRKSKYAEGEIEAKWKKIHKNIRLNIAGAKSQLLAARLKSVSKSWDPTFVMIDTFLTKVNKVLSKATPSNLEVNKATFMDLFQHFARIFLVEFSPAMVKQSVIIGGMEVTSNNDLRYDYEDHESYDQCDDAARIVVTVAEVKKGAIRKKVHCRKRKLCISKVQRSEGKDNIGGATAADDDIDNDEDGDTGDKTPTDITDDDRVEFSGTLRGELGIALLADIDRSCLKEVNNKRVVLGLAVEATWVRLTCLELNDVAALREVQNKPPQEDAPHIGTIYYTRAYDMLARSDRSVLIYIMRYLLFLSNDTAEAHLPKLLHGFLRD